jgi:hypothetical protein
MTSAGVAKLCDGQPAVLTSVGHKGADSKSWVHRIRRIVSQSRAVIQAIGRDCDLIVVEAPLTFSGGPNNGDAFDRYAVFIGVCSQILAWKTPLAIVHNATRCKWATGKGGKSSKELTTAEHKREILLAVREQWAQWANSIRNDDIADALTLAGMGALHLGDPLPFEPRRSQREGLASVEWPQVVTA